MSGTVPAAMPAAYYRRQPGTDVPDVFALWLDEQVGLQSLRRRAVEHNSPQILAVLHALMYGANLQRETAASNGSGAPSGSARKFSAPSPEVAPELQVMTATQAAAVLDRDPRTVRYACASGRLPAVRQDRGWLIARTDLEQYRRDNAA